MAEVAVSRSVDAPVETVAKVLSPRSIVEAEGTFDVESVEDAGDGWTVHASAPGMSARFSVRTEESGYVYEQLGDDGPFDEMTTRLTLVEDGSTTRLEAASTVDLGLPLRSVTDRVAGWKRRGELERALRRLAERAE